ncbi:hypothetical protein ACFVH6_23680 [Spirillospora sp. NPDC127200]
MAANTTRTPATNTTDATADAVPAPAADTATIAPGTVPGAPDVTVTPADAPAGLTDTAAAVWSAVATTPTATVPVIADVSGLTRKIVKDELAVLQAAGHLTRTPGDKGVNTDTWTLTAPAPADTTDAPGGEDVEDGAAGDAPAPAGVVSAEVIADAVAIMQGEADRRAAAEAELRREIAEEEARRAKVLAELARRQTAEETRAALADLITAATAAYAAVAAGDDEATAAGLEKVFTATGDVRRAAKAPARPATGGASRTGTGGNGGSGHRAAPRPLRPDVAAHMAAHPDAELTPGEVARVLGRSSGAVANAMATMANDGEIVMTSEKPVRYRHATPTAKAGDATDAPAGEAADTTPAAPDAALADTATATA